MSVSPELRAQLKASFAGQKKSAEYNIDPQLWAKDKLGVHLWSKQQEITESVRDNKRTVVASCHGSGKALTLDTPLRTPSGYVTMRDVQPEDYLLDENYMPTRVTHVTEVQYLPTVNIHMTNTETGDSTILTTSHQHEWRMLSQQAQAQIAVLCQRHGIKDPDWSYWMHYAKKVMSVDLLKLRVMRPGYIIPAARPALDLEPVAYRVSGPAAYPGLGSSGGALDHLRDMFRQYGTVDECGRLCLRYGSKRAVTNIGDPAVRRALPVPPPLALARTLLEADGHRTLLTKRRRGYHMTYELSVTSDPLGVLRNVVPDGDPILRPEDIEAIARQAWDHNPMNGYHANNTQHEWKFVSIGGWSVNAAMAGQHREVKCVQVDSDNHLYLAGPRDVPTHNSMIASVIAAWWIDTHPPGTAIVVSTAPTYAQVHAILWEEIRKHHATAKEKGLPLPGSITMADNWNLPGGQLVGFGRKPKDGDRHAFQGIHRRYVLAILDEACGVPEELWTGAEAITTNEGCRILAIGNPDDRDTEFGKNFVDPATAGDWNRISIPASTTPNLTGEKVPPLLNEVLVSKAWCDERKRAWGEDDPRYISKVLAEFPEQNAASLFSPTVIATAFEDAGRKLQGTPVTLYFGVDVARYGGDLNVLTMFDGIRVTVLDSWSGVDTVSSAALVLTKVGDIVKDRKVQFADIRVDAVGLGAGVVDTLAARRVELEQELEGTGREPWFVVREMHGSAAAPKDVGGSVQGYGNARAWWYDQLKHLMRSGSIEIGLHAKLKEELEGVRYEYKNGKLYIESKEEIRKRNGKSPDFADSVVYAVAPVHEGLMPGQTVSEDPHDLEEDLDAMWEAMGRENQIAPY